MSAERNAVQWNVPIHTMECSDPHNGMFRSIQWNVPIHTMECTNTPHRKGDLCQQHGNGPSLLNPHWGKHHLSHLYFHFTKRHSQGLSSELFNNYIHKYVSGTYYHSTLQMITLQHINSFFFLILYHVFAGFQMVSKPVEQHPPFAVMQRIFNAS